MQVEPIRVDLPFDPTAPCTARRLVDAALPDESEALVEDVALIVSELVTNAVMHGAAPVQLVIGTAPGVIRIEVCDGSILHPNIPNDETRRPHGGRGLTIVAKLSDHWGWHPRGNGKCVWAACTSPTD